MKITGYTDDSFDTGTRVFYTVNLKENLFTDVMCIRGEFGNYEYLMQCQDGGTVYTKTSDGRAVCSIGELGYSENEIIQFVLQVQKSIPGRRTAEISGLLQGR